MQKSCIKMHLTKENTASFAMNTTTMSIAKKASKLAGCSGFSVANIEAKKALFDRN